jgi:hypothetical protein
MDAGRVMVLRELLASSGWVERTTSFAKTMRRSTKEPGGLLLVGTPDHEPWHLAAHLDDEAQFSGAAELSPTLVRYAPPPGAPAHLSFSLQRLEQAKRGETVFVVSDENAPESLLSRAWDARKVGATVLALETGDDELQQVAHESLTVVSAGVTPISADELPNALAKASAIADLHNDDADAADLVSFDSVQHLVSVAAGEVSASATNSTLKRRFARLLEGISGPRIEPGA